VNEAEPSSPSSAEPPKSAAGAVRGMTAIGAMGWMFLAILLHSLLAALAMSLRGDDKLTLLPGAMAQVLAFSLTLFLILRWHAPTLEIRSFLALRSTAWLSYPLSFLLGCTVWLPLVWCLDLIAKRWPLKESIIQESLDGPLASRIPAMIFIAVLGPIIEEVLVRGALVKPLMARAKELSPFSFSRRAEPGSEPEQQPLRKRSTAALEVALITAILFVWMHVQWQTFPMLFVVGCALGGLRMRSASLIPPILLHVGFNSTSLALSHSFPDLESVPGLWAVLGLGASIVIASLLWSTLASPAAERARAEELAT